MTTIEATEIPDTRDMVTVHRFLRREFRLAPGLVERVGEGDVQRAALVGRHLDFMSEFLHHHHTAEDDVLWPVLLERVPDDLAPLVELMEAQHERVDELLQEINALVPVWTSTASAADRDRLAGLLAELYVGLHEHMEAEETRILPLAASCMSVPEWKAIGEAATQEHPKKQLPLILGMIEYEGDPEVVAELVGNAPKLLQQIVPPLSKRAFRKYCLALHGTATP